MSDQGGYNVKIHGLGKPLNSKLVGVRTFKTFTKPARSAALKAAKKNDTSQHISSEDSQIIDTVTR
jgi:hypothetical protein